MWSIAVRDPQDKGQGGPDSDYSPNGPHKRSTDDEEVTTDPQRRLFLRGSTYKQVSSSGTHEHDNWSVVWDSGGDGSLPRHARSIEDNQRTMLTCVLVNLMPP